MFKVVRSLCRFLAQLNQLSTWNPIRRGFRDFPFRQNAMPKTVLTCGNVANLLEDFVVMAGKVCQRSDSCIFIILRILGISGVLGFFRIETFLLYHLAKH